MRTPEAFYFKHGQCTFKKVRGEIIYFKAVWDETGTHLSIIESSLLRDEAHLKELQNLGSVKP